MGGLKRKIRLVTFCNVEKFRPFNFDHFWENHEHFSGADEDGKLRLHLPEATRIDLVYIYSRETIPSNATSLL